MLQRVIIRFTDFSIRRQTGCVLLFIFPSESYINTNIPAMLLLLTTTTTTTTSKAQQKEQTPTGQSMVPSTSSGEIMSSTLRQWWWVGGRDEKMPENTNAILRMSSSKDSE